MQDPSWIHSGEEKEERGGHAPTPYVFVSFCIFKKTSHVGGSSDLHHLHISDALQQQQQQQQVSGGSAALSGAQRSICAPHARRNNENCASSAVLRGGGRGGKLPHLRRPSDVHNLPRLRSPRFTVA